MVADFDLGHLERSYLNLPESIRKDISPKEYAWLGQEERDRLIERESYPEETPDD